MKLFMLAPTVAFAARVNMPSGVTYPVDEIQFDTVTTGTFSSIVPNMTVYFGSSAGASDLGVTRVRKLADSDTLFFGRSSKGAFYGQVEPVDDCYLTVFHDWRVWPKIPYIDPSGVVYMDSDLDWATWGQYSPPISNLGSGFAGTIDPGTGLITVDFSGLGSFTTHPGATIAAYGWNVYDGTITVGTSSSNAITATFGAGFRFVTLGIIDSNSQSHYAHVPVLAIDPDADPCISNFTIERHTIRPDGQEISIRVREDIPTSTYPDNTLVLLLNGEPASASDRSNVLFMGWAEQEAADIVGGSTATLRDVVLHCVDVAGRLKTLPGFPQVLSHADTPTQWSEQDGPDINRFLAYILHNQTTALALADFTWAPDGEDYLFTTLYSQGASLFEQASGRAQAMIPDHLLTCDRSGALRVLPDPQLMATGDRTATVQTTLDAGDYTSLSYTQQRHPRAHWLRSDAFLVSSTEVETLFSIAPGLTPGFGEMAAEDRGHLARSQDDLNITTGHRYALLNAPQGLFRITLANGNDLGIEPADLTWVNLTIPATVAAQRGLSFTAARGLVREMDIRYNSGPTGLVKTVTLQWQREVVGVTAVIEPVAPIDPIDNGGGWGPAPGDFVPPDFGDATVYYNPVKGYVMWDGAHVLRTWDVLAASPVWELIDTGLSGNLRDIRYVHYEAETVGAWCMTDVAIYWCADLMATTPTWTSKLAISAVQAAEVAPDDGTTTFKCMAPYDAQPGYLCVATGPLAGDTDNQDWPHCYFWYTHDYGATWTMVDAASTLSRTVSGHTHGHCYSALYAMEITRSDGVILCIRSAPVVVVNGDYQVCVSYDLGATWAFAANNFTIGGNNRQDFSLLHPFPDLTDASYVTQGAVGTNRLRVQRSNDMWATSTEVVTPSGTPAPTGYIGASSLWRVNKRTFEDGHVIAWLKHSGDNFYHLMESLDSGATWSLLYDSGLTAGNITNTGAIAIITTGRYNTPNGWPADGNVWFMVRGGTGSPSGTVTDAILSSTDNFATSPVSRIGNLASVLPGGATGWTTGPAGGFCLPKVSVNV